ncbi:hypothetical protein KGQ20_46745, partial [Catenulispora sp. NF23]|nr:hypothetical protein [Catenulispora pinistramenti]
MQRREWAAVPAMRGVSRSTATGVSAADFGARLATWQNPSFQREPRRQVRTDAPGGRLVARAIARTGTAASLELPAMNLPLTAPVQRSVEESEASASASAAAPASSEVPAAPVVRQSVLRTPTKPVVQPRPTGPRLTQATVTPRTRPVASVQRSGGSPTPAEPMIAQRMQQDSGSPSGSAASASGVAVQRSASGLPAGSGGSAAGQSAGTSASGGPAGDAA